MPSSGLRRLFPPQKVSVFSPVLNDPAVLSMANFRIYSMKEEMGGVDWEQRAGATGQRRKRATKWEERSGVWKWQGKDRLAWE